ncbi:MAG: hypothetical protein A2W91_02900 [Bacteroidetes bacterium GWF2_38_335]|nr:MAG: hypothetical protein A2W91_02900 [Bacteroidetes bacterium GWF2_38_335]OFY77561.1 MAG: hypothetical protein A2281_01860 [Bacteroidetes bacterium RIFOXYA12_FULL_38_20]
MINYIFASSAGFLLNSDPITFNQIVNAPWFFLTLIIGTIFVLTFYLTAISMQRAGVSVTIVAARMSVIIPMVFSMLAYNEHINIYKILGILLTIAGVSLTVYKKTGEKTDFKAMLLPVSLFLFLGIADSVVKFSQAEYGTGQIPSVFTAVIFLISCITAFTVGLTSKQVRNDLKMPKTYLLGGFLGLVNFGSIYFFLQVLELDILDSSIAFGVNNISIVLIAVLIAYVFFREKLTRINYIGIIFSILAVTLLMISNVV